MTADPSLLLAHSGATRPRLQERRRAMRVYLDETATCPALVREDSSGTSYLTLTPMVYETLKKIKGELTSRVLLPYLRFYLGCKHLPWEEKLVFALTYAVMRALMLEDIFIFHEVFIHPHTELLNPIAGTIEIKNTTATSKTQIALAEIYNIIPPIYDGPEVISLPQIVILTRVPQIDIAEFLKGSVEGPLKNAL